jgi:hypothetical protein
VPTKNNIPGFDYLKQNTISKDIIQCIAAVNSVFGKINERKFKQTLVYISLQMNEL